VVSSTEYGAHGTAMSGSERSTELAVQGPGKQFLAAAFVACSTPKGDLGVGTPGGGTISVKFRLIIAPGWNAVEGVRKNCASFHCDDRIIEACTAL